MNGFFNENKAVASIVLVVAIMLLRWAIVRLLKKKQFRTDDQYKRWRNNINNVTQLLIASALIIVWISELRYAALSIAAFIVAIVIATREYIQNILGAFYLITARPFSVGDWIVVDAYTGEVVRSDWMSTTLLEVDIAGKSYGHTGKTLVVPNNQFATKNVQNLNFMRRYVSHSFDIVRESGEGNLYEARQLLLDKAVEYCAEFNEVGGRYNSLIESRLRNSIAGPEPSIRFSTSHLGKNVMSVSIFCPTEQAVSIEQKLMEDFYVFWYERLDKRNELSKSSNSDEK